LETHRKRRRRSASEDELTAFTRKLTFIICVILSIIGIILTGVLYPQVPVASLTSGTMIVKSNSYPDLYFMGLQELVIRNPNFVYDVTIRNITFTVSYRTYDVIGFSDTLYNLTIPKHQTRSYRFNFSFTQLQPAMIGNLFLDCRAYHHLTLIFNGEILCDYGLSHSDLSFVNFSSVVPCQ